MGRRHRHQQRRTQWHGGPGEANVTHTVVTSDLVLVWTCVLEDLSGSRTAVACVRGLRGPGEDVLRAPKHRRPMAASRQRWCPACQVLPSLGKTWRLRLGCASWRSSASGLLHPQCACWWQAKYFLRLRTRQVSPRPPRIPLAPSFLPRLVCECKGSGSPQDAS